MRTFVVSLALAAASALLPPTASAQVSVNIHVPGIVAVAPPAPRVEYLPAPRPGQVWVQGNWHWQQDDYAWRPGYWQRARPDHAWASGRWVRANGGYRWVEGGWRPHHGKKHRYYDDDDRHHHKHHKHHKHRHHDHDD